MARDDNSNGPKICLPPFGPCPICNGPAAVEGFVEIKSLTPAEDIQILCELAHTVDFFDDGATSLRKISPMALRRFFAGTLPYHYPTCNSGVQLIVDNAERQFGRMYPQLAGHTLFKCKGKGLACVPSELLIALRPRLKVCVVHLNALPKFGGLR